MDCCPLDGISIRCTGNALLCFSATRVFVTDPESAKEITFILQNEDQDVITVNDLDFPCLIDVRSECKIYLNPPISDSFLVITMENVPTDHVGEIQIFQRIPGKSSRLIGIYSTDEYGALNFLFLKSENRFFLC